MKFLLGLSLISCCAQSEKNMTHTPMDGTVDVYMVGDSTTFGTGSTTLNGYRGPLNTQLDADRTGGAFPGTLLFPQVGNTTSGTAPTDHHRGIPSSTTVVHIADDLTQLPAVVPASQCIVIVHIGLNDGTSALLTTQFFDHYMLMIRREHNLLRSKLPRFIFSKLEYVTTVPNSRIDSMNADLDRAWIELAREGVEFETMSWAIPGLPTTDGVHPTDSGYQQIAVTGPSGFNYRQAFRALIGYPL